MHPVNPRGSRTHPVTDAPLDTPVMLGIASRRDARERKPHNLSITAGSSHPHGE